jgi:Uma2 family endonuclease
MVLGRWPPGFQPVGTYTSAMALALPWGAPLTHTDLAEVPDDGHRYELVDGVLVVTPVPGTAHQRCVYRLAALLLAAMGPDMDVLGAPYDYLVGPSTLFQPDVLVARREDLGTARLERPPLLVVEVLSPSTRLTDLGTKRLAYEAAGVPAYWLVDPDEPSLTALRLNEGRYAQEAKVGADGRYQARYPFKVAVVPGELVGHQD